MSQRYFGRPLADDPTPPLPALLATVFALPAALLVGSVFDPDALTAERLALALGVQAAATALFAGLEGWDLWRSMRRAEPAGSVTAPSAPVGEPHGVRLVAAAVASLVLIVGAGALFGDAYTFVAGGAALYLGEKTGPVVAQHVARRRQRRLGRRFYRTVGEPEKIVWLGASGLE